jgi:hypothetical protein
MTALLPGDEAAKTLSVWDACRESVPKTNGQKFFSFCVTIEMALPNEDE